MTRNRVAGSDGGVLCDRLQRLGVPGVADDRRQRVALAREDLQDLRELRFEHEPTLVGRGCSAGLAARVVVADLPDQSFARRQSRGHAASGEVAVDVGEQRVDMVPGGAFAALAGRSDEDHELVEVMVGCLDGVVDVASGGGTERDEELRQQRHRVGLGVRGGPRDELARGTV
ncbi:MAG: hypothetical protein ACR2H2_12125 [Solirubrobacteraceae bacterium]